MGIGLRVPLAQADGLLVGYAVPSRLKAHTKNVAKHETTIIRIVLPGTPPPLPERSFELMSMPAMNRTIQHARKVAVVMGVSLPGFTSPCSLRGHPSVVWATKSSENLECGVLVGLHQQGTKD